MRLRWRAVANGFDKGYMLTILLNAYDVLGTVEREVICKVEDLFEPGYEKQMTVKY